jgi:hypothetical protein
MSNDKRTAIQRIEDLERALMSLYQTADNMARDMMMIKDAIKLLGNKLDAVVKASERGSVNDTVVAQIMIENNVSELTEKVESLKAQGILTAETAATERSFVVGREIDAEGKVANPRLQFTMGALNPEVREKLVGGMPGQVITLEEGKLKFEVLEVYSINSPAPAAEAPAAETQDETLKSDAAAATEAPAVNS